MTRQNLSQQQRQTMTLTPQQVRYYRLLEMSEAQLDDEIRRQLEENPALESADEETLPQQQESADDLMRADYLNEDDIPPTSLFRPEREPADPGDRAADDDAPGIVDTLTRQIAAMTLPDDIADTAAYIAGTIDNNGYMTRTPQQLVDDLTLEGRPVTADTVRRAIAAIRTLEPAGIGAWDLRDTLLLQLERPEHPTQAQRDAAEVVRHYFDLFALHRYDRIEAASHIPAERLAAATDAIRALDPKPAAALADSPAAERLRHITADWRVLLDDRGTPYLSPTLPTRHLRIAEAFLNDAGSAADIRYIRTRREEGRDFIDILTQRQSTLQRVLQAIVARQTPYLATGDEERLRPMVLRELAADTGLDTSVISRATQGKYLDTPYGMRPLKFFFSEGPGDDSSSRAVTAALRRLVENEEISHPLSDETLARLLKEKGYDVARRTVAKYREAAGIPPSRLRRRPH